MAAELKQMEVRLCLKEVPGVYSEEVIKNADEAVRIMAEVMKDLDREHCCVVNMDARGCPINYNIVNIGGLRSVEIDIANIFKSAILQNSNSILLLHNHPAGQKTISQEDIATTKRVALAGAMINIPLNDHVIIVGGTGEHISIGSERPELLNTGKIMVDMFALMEGNVPQKESESAAKNKKRRVLRYHGSV